MRGGGVRESEGVRVSECVRVTERKRKKERMYLQRSKTRLHLTSTHQAG